MPFKDKVKAREASRRHYARNSEAIKAKVTVHNYRLRTRNRDFVNEIKSTTPCTDCGQIYPPYVMQFDHVLGGKRGNVASLAHSRVSIETLKTEMAKCELVCANCHAIRTHSWRDEIEKDFPDE